MQKWSIFYGLYLFLIATTILLPQTASAVIGGTVTGYEPNILQTGNDTTIKVKVRNTGQATRFYLNVTESPGSWSVATPSPQPLFIEYDKTAEFTMVVNPGFSAGTGTVKVQLLAEDIYGDIQNLSTRSLFFQVFTPPGSFFISTPLPNAQIEGEYNISWTAALNAQTYAVLIYDHGANIYDDPPVFSIVGLVNPNYTHTTNDLVKGLSYDIYIFATNQVATVQNSGGPRVVQVKAAPALGSFSVTAPVENAETTTQPFFEWTVSASAESYRVRVLPEVDGEPVNNPVREVTGIVNTFWGWEGTPLEGGRWYYLTVEAIGETQTRFNEQGPVRFFASGLGHFELASPTAETTNVNRMTSFKWGKAEGATHYRIEVFDTTSSYVNPYVVGTVTQPENPLVEYFQPSGSNLIPGRRYRWHVTAYTAREARLNENGDRYFVVSTLRPFDLQSPKTEEAGIPQLPLFKWEAGNPGANYFVEVAKEGANGKPAGTVLRSSVLTTTNWQYNLAPLEVGQRYLWRVGAFIGDVIVYNYPTWQPFRVTPFNISTFALKSPAGGASNITTTPLFEWNSVVGAQTYRLNIFIPGVMNIPPIETTETQADLLEYEIHLNGETTYQWNVEAIAEGGLVKSETRVFTTTQRNVATSCDIIDHFLGRQLLSDREKASVGFFGNADMSLYIQYISDPDAITCPPQEVKP